MSKGTETRAKKFRFQPMFHLFLECRLALSARILWLKLLPLPRSSSVFSHFLPLSETCCELCGRASPEIFYVSSVHLRRKQRNFRNRPRQARVLFFSWQTGYFTPCCPVQAANSTSLFVRPRNCPILDLNVFFASGVWLISVYCGSCILSTRMKDSVNPSWRLFCY